MFHGGMLIDTPLIIEGSAGLVLTKPNEACLNPVPKPSIKRFGSFGLTQASIVGVPSIVVVCVQVTGFPESSAVGGTAIIPYLFGIRFFINASPTFKL